MSLSLISCSTSPNSPNNTQQNNTSSNTQNQPNVSSTDLAKIELANLVDEEDVFSDSTDLLNDNTFTTKADGTLLSGKSWSECKYSSRFTKERRITKTFKR
ncbi:MAG: hypothetical protein KatS3mg068_1833 [Candidatus Sericytochromatia bacterium]|nr:MAG: hypothetical protein KatS3mg068_1833 [Candidatus Sericytochromatia bacterium]